ncbi:TPA: long-chain fatty acid--CoA ligase [Vibrio vulnificus]|nr:long-chain fatty acid--CoA ligase [Vibrio vulnificus]HDY7720845.1 long-chain fatty acid--CoA ligase [Vibrio vulnificus]HDY7735423.1 long-chain fatty acid--CoA ligase [Vibrio vulnificus]HDY7748150.1 long-chain fatty acid--CoA ligase [Vibrio vulnificus]HDY7756459.1 long-chain fatty acid--CoA ligase [Vibrio vulnificus]
MIEYLEKINTYSDLTALCFEDESYTYQQVSERIEYYYNKSSALKPGSVVSIISDYSFESISLFFALAKRKCIIAPIVSANVEEIAKRENEILPDATVTIQVKGEVQFSYHDNLAPRHDLISKIRAKEHAGLILFSSGSTGKPKAMIHDLNVLSSTYLDKKPKKLSIMVFLMFDHIGGLNTLLNSMSMGAKIVIPTKREPEHVAYLIERENVNLLPASPTFLNMMLIAGVQNNFNLKSLRMITYGTEAMPESLLARLKQEWPRVKLLQTFGTSETGIAQTSSRSSSSLEIKIDDPNQEFKIVNGELWLRSKTQILGYLNHDMSGFSDDGWFKTGDLVEESEDGYLKIIGRLKEVINVGGEKVLPSEVESCILEVKGVSDCVVYAVANAITGQTVATNVVLEVGADEKVVKKEIRKHCKANLDRYKVPTKIIFSKDAAIGERFKKIRLDKYEA